MQQPPDPILAGALAALGPLLDHPLVAASVAAVVLLSFSVPRGGRGRRTRTRRVRPPSDGAHRRVDVLTPNEVEFHARLLDACAGRFEAWPQVPMLSLVQPAVDGLDAFRVISNRRVDWAIARDGRAFAVVELDDRTHDGKRDQDAARDRILRSCGYAVIRYDSRAKPSRADIRRDVVAAAPTARG